jgi:hypothetical protein
MTGRLQFSQRPRPYTGFVRTLQVCVAERILVATFSHPDCTVGSRLELDLPQPRLAGLRVNGSPPSPPVGNCSGSPSLRTLPRRCDSYYSICAKYNTLGPSVNSAGGRVWFVAVLEVQVALPLSCSNHVEITENRNAKSPLIF